ncbi:hypothetical protein BD413DRAFT_578013 [Trametes elegans]|nr:hypothetical protein BD413DRAFT_578013 [Trametes elegans]
MRAIRGGPQENADPRPGPTARFGRASAATDLPAPAILPTRNRTPHVPQSVHTSTARHRGCASSGPTLEVIARLERFAFRKRPHLSRRSAQNGNLRAWVEAETMD